MERYSVVLSGFARGAEFFRAAMMKQGMKVAQIERVIEAVPCVLKQGLTLQQAQKYEATFQQAGGLVQIHNEDELLAAGTPIPGPPPPAPPLADPRDTELGPPPAEARLFGATRAIDIPSLAADPFAPLDAPPAADPFAALEAVEPEDPFAPVPEIDHDPFAPPPITGGDLDVPPDESGGVILASAAEQAAQQAAMLAVPPAPKPAGGDMLDLFAEPAPSKAGPAATPDAQTMLAAPRAKVVAAPAPPAPAQLPRENPWIPRAVFAGIFVVLALFISTFVGYYICLDTNHEVAVLIHEELAFAVGRQAQARGGADRDALYDAIDEVAKQIGVRIDVEEIIEWHVDIETKVGPDGEPRCLVHDGRLTRMSDSFRARFQSELQRCSAPSWVVGFAGTSKARWAWVSSKIKLETFVFLNEYTPSE